MSEKYPAFGPEDVKYTGIFDSQEYYGIVLNWLKDHGYDLNVKLNAEDVQESGKKSVVKIDVEKKVNEYCKLYHKIDITLGKVNKISIEKEGKEFNLEKGSAGFRIQSWVNTDYEDNWKDTVFKWFIRTFVDTFIIKINMKTYYADAKKDAKDLISHVKTYFNMEYKIFNQIK